jgi:tetratricopeptide (TPR) repeat protein
MRKLNVFLSSEMTGELDRERDGVRILFESDSILKEFFELYAIEEHASAQPIENAYINEVKKSDLHILLLDKQLRDAVEKEFHEARNNNLKIFVYIRNRTDKRDDKLAEFIGQEAYQFHCGSFYDSIDLCHKIRSDIFSDLMAKYSGTIATEKKKQEYITISSRRDFSVNSLCFYDYGLLSRISQSEDFKDMDTDQLIVLATLRAEETGNLKEALLIYEIILLRESDNWQAYNNRGLILTEMGHPEDALFSYIKALELNPESHATLYNVGNYYRDKGRYDEAIEYYQKALEIKPDKTSALGNLVGIYFSKKEYQIALKYAEKAYSYEKDEISTSNFCLALGLNGKKEKALINCEKLKDTKYHEKIRAYIFYAVGEWGNCINEINTFLRLWGFDYDLSIKLIYCYVNVEKVEEAIIWLKDIENKYYLHPIDYNHIGWMLYEKKLKLDYSAELLKKSVKRDPTLLAAWRNLQCVMAELMEFEEGLKISDQALKYYPDDPGIIMNRVKFLFLSGDIRKCANYAIKEFTRLFGANMPPSEIEKTINQSLMNAGINDIGSFEKIFKTMVQFERSKIKR